VRTNILKIFAISTLMIFIGFGISMADGGKENDGNRGHAYGHYQEREYRHYKNYAPRPLYVEHHYRPVVIERRVYRQPVVYQAPAPRGFFFGMTVVEPGMAFSFGVGGH
jgi:hypothetical protein